MNLSWKLGKVAGIDLFLHPSALLLFLFGANFRPTAFENAAFVVALLASIVLHELGHALMARRYGIQTEDITLYMFGGVARLERMPRSSGPELLIALAGPAVNFAIVAVLAAFIRLSGLIGSPRPGFLADVLWLNLVLGVFNLLPAFPMDGGRVFRAVLSPWLGRLKATEMAAAMGRGLAIAGAMFCLINGMYMTLVLAAFVYFAGSVELQQVRMEGRESGRVEGFVNVPEPPPGFRWANRGDGILRLVPIMVEPGWRGRSWS